MLSLITQVYLNEENTEFEKPQGEAETNFMFFPPTARRQPKHILYNLQLMCRLDERKKPTTVTKKLISDFAIFCNIRRSHKAYFSKKFCLGGAFEGNFGRWGEGGNHKRNNLLLFDKGFRIKLLHRQFRFVFYRRLISKEPENLISWHDRFAESVFSNLFPDRGTSIFLLISFFRLGSIFNQTRRSLPQAEK